MIPLNHQKGKRSPYRSHTHIKPAAVIPAAGSGLSGLLSRLNRDKIEIGQEFHCTCDLFICQC